MKPAFFLVLLSMCFSPFASGQLTQQMVYSTYFIKSGDKGGTAFTLEYKSRQYLITAAHVVDRLPNEGGHLEIMEHVIWKDLQVGRINVKSKDADIAVLIPGRPLMHSDSLQAIEGKFNYGAEVYFLGFPLGLHTIFEGEYVPVIKHGFVSASDNSDPEAVITYIDGFNNEGFSGGPVLTKNSKGEWQVVSVISGYLQEHAKQHVRKQDVDTSILVNSGIIVTYNIGIVTEAIDSSTTVR
jgi:hypothetical protein